MPADPFREQLMKTLQAQAQAQAQQMQGQPQQPTQPEQPTEQQAQPMAHGGIAALPAHNMRFAPGGVIGFAEGGQGSEAETDEWESDENDDLDTSGVDTAAIAQIISPERIKAMQAQRDKITSAPLPALVSREDAYKQLDALSPIKPWEAQKTGIEQLRAKQADILQRATADYEQEKGSRGLGQWAALLGSHLGGQAQAVTNYQNAMAQRDAAFTRQLKDDLEFQKDLFNMTTAANKDEFSYYKDQALSKVTDSQKAAELFQKDRATLVKALNGEYGPALKLLGAKYAADVRAKTAASKTAAEKFNLDKTAFDAAVQTIAKEVGKDPSDPEVQNAAAQRVYGLKATPAAISAESRASTADVEAARKEAILNADLIKATPKEREEWIKVRAEEIATQRVKNIGRARGQAGAPAASTPANRAPLSSFMNQ